MDEVLNSSKFWTKNFFLLWQGKLVSTLGDVVYQIAMGFWILRQTHSPALMGTLMAVLTIPTIIVSPFAGVVVDRSDRKKLLILMDVIRGMVIAVLGLLVITGNQKIWMFFVAAVILGSCATFFNPATRSVIPDIVSEAKINKANSAFGIIDSLINILGNAIGGFLFGLLGAPLLIFFNGFSYLFSAFTECFMDIPKNYLQNRKKGFFKELRDGIGFVWRLLGLRYSLAIFSLSTFSSVCATVLFIPFFEKGKNLGVAKYGMAMAVLTIGALLGFILISILNIPNKRRSLVFFISNILASLFMAIFPFFNYSCILLFLGLGGVFTALTQVMIESSIQVNTPAIVRGKVFAIRDTVISVLVPLAMVISGILAEFIAIKLIILSGFTLNVLFTIPLYFLADFKSFVNLEKSKEELEKII